jgi:hypothetical protein
MLSIHISKIAIVREVVRAVEKEPNLCHTQGVFNRSQQKEKKRENREKQTLI